MKRILVAGVGNIFLGDDGFGVEVIRQFPRETLPPQVCVRDFGIRGHDLAYALADGYDAAILIDATPRGDPPGTVYLIEPDLAALGRLEPVDVNGHGMGPIGVLQMARALGAVHHRVYVVGCEPEKLDSEDGRMGLSESAQAAVPRAIEMVQSLLGHLLESDTKIELGIMPA